MSTQPRMSAPIGRLSITTTDTRRKATFPSGRWRSADPPMEVEVSEVEEAPLESTHPPFYPYAPARRGKSSG